MIYHMSTIIAYTYIVATLQKYILAHPDTLPGTEYAIGISYEYMSWFEIIHFHLLFVFFVLMFVRYLSMKGETL